MDDTLAGASSSERELNFERHVLPTAPVVRASLPADHTSADDEHIIDLGLRRKVLSTHAMPASAAAEPFEIIGRAGDEDEQFLTVNRQVLPTVPHTQSE